MVFDVLERCSVEKFVLHIRGIQTNHDQKVKVVTLEYLLNEAESKYQEIETWNGAKQEYSFKVDNGCWNCGSPDHFACDCPDPDRRPARGRGGQGRGCGRYGRGGGCGGKRNSYNNNRREGSYDRKTDLRFKPPGKEEARTRKLGDVVEYWCGTCRCWTNHPTDKHADIALLAANPVKGDLVIKDNRSSTDKKDVSNKTII